MECLLKFDKVVKCYSGDTRALDNVSLEINQGEFVSVIGPSGSGKSTFLRSINKLIPLTEGEIYLDGETISDKKGRALRLCRRKIGMVFQNYNLVPGLKGILGRYSEEDKHKAVEILEELGLEDFVYNRASDLSGGQKQRVGIARAIMQNPKLLLCDEPIASLDPSSAKVIMDMLYDMIKRRNIACIVNLHQVDVAKKYSTRIIGLSKGKILFDGTPDELDDATIEKIYGRGLEDLMLGGSEGAR